MFESKVCRTTSSLVYNLTTFSDITITIHTEIDSDSKDTMSRTHTSPNKGQSPLEAAIFCTGMLAHDLRYLEWTHTSEPCLL